MRKLPALLSEYHPPPLRRRCFCSVAPCAQSVSSFPRPFLPVIITTTNTTTRFFTVEHPVLDVCLVALPPSPPVLLVWPGCAYPVVPCCPVVRFFSLFFCRPGTVAPSPQHLPAQHGSQHSAVPCGGIGTFLPKSLARSLSLSPGPFLGRSPPANGAASASEPLGRVDGSSFPTPSRHSIQPSPSTSRTDHGSHRNHRNHNGAEREKWLMLTAQAGTAK